MRVAIGMIVYNEVKMLSTLLHTYARDLGTVVAINTGSSDDSGEIIYRNGGIVNNEIWVDFSTARNQAIKLAEDNGFDYMVVMDADEAILPVHAGYLKSLMTGPSYTLPRLEFIDREHINPIFYPDFHDRIFPLHQGYHYKGILHEGLHDKDGRHVSSVGLSIKVPCVPIFHYGKSKSPEEITLKYDNQARTGVGLPRTNSILSLVPNTYSHGPKLKYFGETPI